MTVELSDEEKNAGKNSYDLADFRILIIEDAAFISGLLSSCLSEMGVGSVITAEDLKSAKDKILDNNAAKSSKNIDMIILDWLLTDGKGGELLNWIRRHKSPTIQFAPVIVCSAYTSEELVFESRDSGANEVMVKPVSAEKIAKRMLHIIDHPRPYVQSPNFMGPDRRRRVMPYEEEDRRVAEPEVISEQ